MPAYACVQVSVNGIFGLGMQGTRIHTGGSVWYANVPTIEIQ
jgi:hypothetical protein